jgi:hypothetical protein
MVQEKGVDEVDEVKASTPFSWTSKGILPPPNTYTQGGELNFAVLILAQVMPCANLSVPMCSLVLLRTAHKRLGETIEFGSAYLRVA